MSANGRARRKRSERTRAKRDDAAASSCGGVSAAASLRCTDTHACGGNPQAWAFLATMFASLCEGALSGHGFTGCGKKRFFESDLSLGKIFTLFANLQPALSNPLGTLVRRFSAFPPGIYPVGNNFSNRTRL